MTIQERLQQIRQRADKATPGPWQTRFIARLFDSVRTDPSVNLATKCESDWTDSDFIAAARTDVPWLCEQLEKHSAALEIAVKQLEWHIGHQWAEHTLTQIREALK